MFVFFDRNAGEKYRVLGARVANIETLTPKFQVLSPKSQTLKHRSESVPQIPDPKTSVRISPPYNPKKGNYLWALGQSLESPKTSPKVTTASEFC